MQHCNCALLARWWGSFTQKRTGSDAKMEKSWRKCHWFWLFEAERRAVWAPLLPHESQSRDVRTQGADRGDAAFGLAHALYQPSAPASPHGVIPSQGLWLCWVPGSKPLCYSIRALEDPFRDNAYHYPYSHHFLLIPRQRTYSVLSGVFRYEHQFKRCHEWASLTDILGHFWSVFFRPLGYQCNWEGAFPANFARKRPTRLRRVWFAWAIVRWCASSNGPARGTKLEPSFDDLGLVQPLRRSSLAKLPRTRESQRLWKQGQLHALYGEQWESCRAQQARDPIWLH